MTSNVNLREKVKAKVPESDSSLPSFLGCCELKWNKGMLAALILPPSPPRLSNLKKGIRQKKNTSWENILGLKRVKLDFSGRSEFQRAVWQRARKIPFGRVRSYGWLAKKIGKPKGARAVGQALGSNPWPLLVPCHRVISSDGSPGGFSAGIEWKRFLLEFERSVTNGNHEVTKDTKFKR